MQGLAVRQCRECDHEGFSTTLRMLLKSEAGPQEVSRLGHGSPTRDANLELEAMGVLLQTRLWERLLMATVEGAHLVSENAACSILDELRPLILAWPFRRPEHSNVQKHWASRLKSSEHDAYPHAMAANIWVEQVCHAHLNTS